MTSADPVRVAEARQETPERKRCGGVLDWFCRIWIIIARRPKEGDPCVTVPGRIISKPDPCIYSQFLLMQLNQPVTWDNPDVRIFRNGVEQDTYNLQADTIYDIQVTVHNSSRSKPAPGTSTSIRWIEFGAGGQIRHPIANLPANVPVWPGTAVVTTQWRTPATPGHYCIEVELSHPDDANPSNNRGWNNTQVHAASSPVERPIRIFNQFPEGCPEIKEGGGRRLRPKRVFLGWGVLGAAAGAPAAGIGPDATYSPLRVVAFVGAGYVVSVLLGLLLERLAAWNSSRKDTRDQPTHDRIPCNLVELTVDSYVFHDEVGKGFDPDAAFAARPPEWPSHIDPTTFMFADGELFRDVVLRVDAPDEPGPPGVFNVSARQGGFAAGGVTITITRGGQT